MTLYQVVALLGGILAGLAAIGCLAAWEAVRERRKHEDALRALAPDVDGTVSPASYEAEPELRFTYRGHPARLTYYASRGLRVYGAHTRLLYDTGRADAFRVHIYPEDMMSRWDKVMGMQDIRVGDPGLDDRFIVKGSDEAPVRIFLTGSARFAIDHLCQPPFNRHLSIRAEDGTLRVQKQGWITDPELLKTFIRLSQVIVDGYLESAGEPAKA